MVYIYRILWLLFYVPIFLLQVIIFTFSLFLFSFITGFYYIKTGSIENTPGIFIPGKLSELLNKYYIKLGNKIENKNTKS